MKIAMVGTRGVPARYGGFETCVEEVGRRLVDRGHEVVVYCRTPVSDPVPTPAAPPCRPSTSGCGWCTCPRSATRSLETLSHTGLSVAHLRAHRGRRRDRVQRGELAVPPAAARRPASRSRPTSTGWSGSAPSGAAPAAAFYRLAESLAVRWSDALIADADGHRRLLPRRVRRRHRAHRLRRADHRSAPRPATPSIERLGLTPGGYHLVVARFEPENHVDVIVDGYRPQRRRQAAGRRRLGAVLRRATPRGCGRSATNASASSAGSGTRGCSTSSTPTPRPTCTGTRSAARTRRCCARSAPGRRRSASTSSSTARSLRAAAGTSAPPTTSPGWSSRRGRPAR